MRGLNATSLTLSPPFGRRSPSSSFVGCHAALSVIKHTTPHTAQQDPGRTPHDKISGSSANNARVLPKGPADASVLWRGRSDLSIHMIVEGLQRFFPESFGSLEERNGRFESVGSIDLAPTIQVDATMRRFVARQRWQASQLGPAVTADRLIAKATTVVESFGLLKDETELSLHNLMEAHQSVSSVEGTTREVASKVVIVRRLGGIPVAGDRIVLTYAIDGTLVKVIGRWEPIDYENSALSSSLDDAAIIERAAERLAASGIDSERVQSLGLRIIYVRNESQRDRIELQAEVAARIEQSGDIISSPLMIRFSIDH